MPNEIDAIHYRMYLLAYDTSTKRVYDRVRTAFLTRAGVLAELALRDMASEVDRVVKIHRHTATTDRPLDQAVRAVVSHQRSWNAWLRHDYRDTLDAVEASLLEMGVMQTTDGRRTGILSQRHASAADPTIARNEQEQAYRVITQAHGAELDPRVATAAALAVIARVPTVARRRELAGRRAEADTLLGQLGSVAPELVDAIRGIRMTMIASQGGMGGS